MWLPACLAYADLVLESAMRAGAFPVLEVSADRHLALYGQLTATTTLVATALVATAPTTLVAPTSLTVPTPATSAPATSVRVATMVGRGSVGRAWGSNRQVGER